MTIAPKTAWPRRRTPWLGNRFGRGLLWPGALTLRLRRTWAAYSVAERWRTRSTSRVPSERRYSVNLSVRLGDRADHSTGRPRPDVGEFRRIMIAPDALLAARRPAGPTQHVPTMATTAPARLELQAAHSSGRMMRLVRPASPGSDYQLVLVAAAPPRVLARGPMSEAAAPARREPGDLLREPAAQRGPVLPAEQRPPDIDRLTDSVMAAIDRRLWSLRERTGRR